MLFTVIWLLACAPEQPPPPPIDINAAIASIAASLDEAARLDLASQDEDARTSWRRAHAEFDTVVEPLLRAQLDGNDVTAIELHFGLFRAAIEAPRGSSRQELRDLKARLRDAAATLAADNDPDSTLAPGTVVRRAPPEL